MGGSIAQGPVSGGTPLTLRGSAFAGGGVGYTCRFTGLSPSGGELTADSDATVINSTAVKCSTPSWTGVEQVVRLSVLRALEQSGVPYTGGAGGNKFEYMSVWSGADMPFTMLGLPAAAAAKGGTLISIQGDGFAAGMGHICSFESCTPPPGRCTTTNVNATVLQSSLLECVSPPFSDFPVGKVAASIKLTLLRPGGIVLYREGGALDVRVTRSTWSAPPYALGGHAGGGWDVMIEGSGFCYETALSSCDNAYSCEFRSTDGLDHARAKQCVGGVDSGATCGRDSDCEGLVCTSTFTATSSYSRIINNTHLLCKAPLWPHPVGEVRIVLLDVTYGPASEMPVGYAGAVRPSFNYTSEVLFSAEPDSVGAHIRGGLNITARGAGFHAEPVSRYDCVVTLSSGSVLSSTPLSRAASLTELLCPAQNMSETDVAESGFFEIHLDGVPLPTSPPGGVPFTVGAVMYQIGPCTSPALDAECGDSGSAAIAGHTLQVSALGLNRSVPHRVVFTAGDDVAISPLDGGGPAGGSVDTPAWPYPSATASVSLQWMPSGGAWVDIEGVDHWELIQVATSISGGAAVYPSTCPGACWPQTIDISGGGFDNRGPTSIRDFGKGRKAVSHRRYACSLVGDSSDEVLQADYVTVDSSLSIRCVLGEKGTPPAYASQNFTTVLSYRGDEQGGNWTNISWALGGAGRRAHVAQGWSGATVPGCVERPCTVEASGGETIRISAYGLTLGTSVRCVYTVPGQPPQEETGTSEGHNLILCPFPEWVSEGGVAAVFLEDGDGKEIAYTGPNGLGTVNVGQVWWIAEPQNASVLGGGLNISVKGRGFNIDSGVTYRARFYGPGGGDAAGDQVYAASVEELELPVPVHYQGYAGKVSISIERCETVGVCSAIMEDSGASIAHNMTGEVFSFTPVWSVASMLYLSGLITCPCSSSAHASHSCTSGIHT